MEKTQESKELPVRLVLNLGIFKTITPFTSNKKTPRSYQLLKMITKALWGKNNEQNFVIGADRLTTLKPSDDLISF